MDLKKRAIISISVGVIGAVLSSIFNIIPCKTGLSIPNSILNWSFCQLNFSQNTALLGLKKLYFGFISNSIISVTILFVILSFISWAILSKLLKIKK